MLLFRTNRPSRGWWRFRPVSVSYHRGFIPGGFVPHIFVRLTTRPISTTGPIPQMDLKSDVISQLGRFFWRAVICNESSIAQIKWHQLYLLQSEMCVCLCLLSDPSNNNSVISSRIASLSLNIAARREADFRKHRGRACYSHEEFILLWLRRCSFWFYFE